MEQGDTALCPFCGGKATLRKDLRDGYESCPEDQDAWAFYFGCVSCAAQGGWAKTEAGALRYWNMRT